MCVCVCFVLVGPYTCNRAPEVLAERGRESERLHAREREREGDRPGLHRKGVRVCEILRRQWLSQFSLSHSVGLLTPDLVQ